MNEKRIFVDYQKGDKVQLEGTKFKGIVQMVMFPILLLPRVIVKIFSPKKYRGGDGNWSVDGVKSVKK